MVRYFVAAGLAAVALPVAAAVVVDPLPPIQPGYTVAIRQFTTLPPTGGPGRLAAAQSLQPIRDGSGRLVASDTRGILYLTDGSGRAPTPYLDLRTQPIGFSNAADPTQTGLMGFAFHPNFNRDPAAPGYRSFYTIDTTAATSATPTGSRDTAVNHDDVLREWTVADPSAATAEIVGTREVMRVTQPRSDHGPGTIAFDPNARPGQADYGKLYIGLGDGGGPNDPGDDAQDLASPFGKILRIDPIDPPGAAAYAIPGDNPFVAQAGALPEVWAYGLRNPQHFSWGTNGLMYISDMGQAQIDEVDLGVRGQNYGWPAREGTFGRSADKADERIFDDPNPGLYADPIAQYDHEEIARSGFGLAAVSGAYLYAGSLVPELVGQVILSDLVSGRLFYFSAADATGAGPATLSELLLTLDGVGVTMNALEGIGRVDLRLGIDAAGELYLLTKRDGDIYRLGAGDLAAVPEPETWAAMLLGLGLAGWRLRRRRPKPGTDAARPPRPHRLPLLR